jgi:hypothetical protein
MGVRTRRFLLIISLLVIASLGAGVVGSAWGRLDAALRPWQRSLAPTLAGPDEDPVALREQVVHLGAENVLLRTRLADYAAIKGEGGIDPRQAVLARARIVGRTVRAGRRFIELDAGALDGVLKGLPACVGWSLAGVVAGLQDGRCLVQQITDSESRIPAAILTGTTVLAEGVVAGTGRRGELDMLYVEDRPGLTIVPGLPVVTVGTDERIPSGLVLGAVSSAERSTTADHWRVRIAPLRSAETAESLLVLGPLRTAR